MAMAQTIGGGARPETPEQRALKMFLEAAKNPEEFQRKIEEFENAKLGANLAQESARASEKQAKHTADLEHARIDEERSKLESAAEELAMQAQERARTANKIKAEADERIERANAREAAVSKWLSEKQAELDKRLILVEQAEKDLRARSEEVAVTLSDAKTRLRTAEEEERRISDLRKELEAKRAAFEEKFAKAKSVLKTI
jgi:hypothetical protein